MKNLKAIARAVKDIRTIITAIVSLSVLIIGGIIFLNQLQKNGPETKAGNQPAVTVNAPEPPASNPRRITVGIEKTAQPEPAAIIFDCKRLTLTVHPEDGQRVSLKLERLYGGNPLKIIDTEGNPADPDRDIRGEGYYYFISGAPYIVRESFTAGDRLRITVSHNTRFAGTIAIEQE